MDSALKGSRNRSRQAAEEASWATATAARSDSRVFIFYLLWIPKTGEGEVAGSRQGN
jgi:hypothetical protein